VDLAAVKEAPPCELARCAIAAARNAHGLVEDAELLSGAGRLARAYSLAGLAVEEVGKAGHLGALAAMPENVRAEAPVARMLEWHQMKLVYGQLISEVPFGANTGVAARLGITPLSKVAEFLASAMASAQDMDRLKQLGLYVDMDQSGHIREPSEVTVAEVRAQLDRARQAARAANALLNPGAPGRLANPAPVGVEFSRSLVSAFGQTRHSRSPEAAADILLNAACELHGTSAGVVNRSCHYDISALTSTSLVKLPDANVTMARFDKQERCRAERTRSHAVPGIPPLESQRRPTAVGLYSFNDGGAAAS
jgi:AbiV family abortive infection protein